MVIHYSSAVVSNLEERFHTQHDNRINAPNFIYCVKFSAKKIWQVPKKKQTPPLFISFNDH